MLHRFWVTAEHTLTGFIQTILHFSVALWLSQRIGVHKIDPGQLCHNPGLNAKKLNAEPFHRCSITAEQTLTDSIYRTFKHFPSRHKSTNISGCRKSIQNNCVTTPAFNAKYRKRNSSNGTNLDRQFFRTITHFLLSPELDQFIGLHKIQCPSHNTRQNMEPFCRFWVTAENLDRQLFNAILLKIYKLSWCAIIQPSYQGTPNRLRKCVTTPLHNAEERLPKCCTISE